MDKETQKLLTDVEKYCARYGLKLYQFEDMANVPRSTLYRLIDAREKGEHKGMSLSTYLTIQKQLSRELGE